MIGKRQSLYGTIGSRVRASCQASIPMLSTASAPRPSRTPGSRLRACTSTTMNEPMPMPRISSSEASSVKIEIAIARRSPDRICGSAAGIMISLAMCRSVAPKLCADQISSRSTPCSPAIVAVMIGNTAVTAMMVIFEASNSPNHKINTGRKAILGIGKPIEPLKSVAPGGFAVAEGEVSVSP